MTRHHKKTSPVANAGLPGAFPDIDQALREKGIDPDRLSVNKLGLKSHLVTVPFWARRMLFAMMLWLGLLFVEHSFTGINGLLLGMMQLTIGLLILQSACEVLVSATERLAARFKWNHYIAGTLAEILATTPELVVIAFIIPVSPAMAFIISLITIYNNALVFSLYSYFLPKEKQGTFLMPTPITEAGTQILIGGGAMGLVIGLVMLTFSSTGQEKTSFSPVDLVFISAVLFVIFATYLFKLIKNYAKEEADVREGLSMNEKDIEQRLDTVYQNVKPSTFTGIAWLFFVGIFAAFAGGEQVSAFALIMTKDLNVNDILAALILAVFAGMSEYVILWQSHKKREYGIALANAFGGITQVMFLVLPFTLVSIAFYQSIINPGHPEFPLGFGISNIFLFLFLFPTFYTLSSLLEEDHTLGLLDTVIMVSIFLFLIVLLVSSAGQ